MTLSEKRSTFTRVLAALISRAGALGYDVALDQVKRTQREADAYAEAGRGISNSLHTLGLAADILAYRNGNYLSYSEDYRKLGECWESLHPLCRWGGRFSKPDGNHFSFEHEGVR